MDSTVRIKCEGKNRRKEGLWNQKEECREVCLHKTPLTKGTMVFFKPTRCLYEWGVKELTKLHIWYHANSTNLSLCLCSEAIRLDNPALASLLHNDTQNHKICSRLQIQLISIAAVFQKWYIHSSPCCLKAILLRFLSFTYISSKHHREKREKIKTINS